MYVPDHFSPPSDEAMVSLIRARSFGALITSDLQATHIPFLLEERTDGLVLVGHVARANPHWQMFDGANVGLVIFQGTDGYISPSWGDAPDACEKLVPTWNYMVVHAKGVPRLVEGEVAAHDLLTRMTAAQEEGRALPWRVEDLAPGMMERLITALVVFEMPIASLEGKWKLSQNRTEADRNAFRSALTDEGRSDLAQAMRD
ncbi:MAG: FMN-binding negative transcriptional regulator [Parvibaculum sp.]